MSEICFNISINSQCRAQLEKLKHFYFEINLNLTQKNLDLKQILPAVFTMFKKTVYLLLFTSHFYLLDAV